MHDSLARQMSREVAARFGAGEALHVDASSLRLGVVLRRGRFIWPQASDGAMVITPAQLSYMLEGIDWRNPIHTFRPQAAG